MSVKIAWKQNILVTDSYLLKLLLVVFGLGLQAFVCDFSRQNICSECLTYTANAYRQTTDKLMFKSVISTVR